MFSQLTSFFLAFGGLSIAFGCSKENKVLIYETSCNHDATLCNFYKSHVNSLGIGYDVSDFTLLTKDDFLKYRAIIFPDPDSTDENLLNNAVSNRVEWSSAIDGNCLILATDEADHADHGELGAQILIENGLNYVLEDTCYHTGLYVSLSQYYGGQAATVELLSEFGEFTTTSDGSCNDEAQIVNSGHSVMNGQNGLTKLTNELLSNWGCTIHAPFTSFSGLPDVWEVLAIDKQLMLPFILAKDLIEDCCSNNKKVLIYGPACVAPYCDFYINYILSLGYSFDIANENEWLSMNSYDFGKYRALLFPDSDSSDQNILNIANNNKNVWSSVIDGNIFILGADEADHATSDTGNDQFAAQTLLKNGIDYVLDNSCHHTGLYVSLSIYYWDEDQFIQIPILDPFGTFITSDVRTCSFNDAAHILQISINHPTMNNLNDDLLSNWNCGVTETFHTFDGCPDNFQIIAIGTDIPADKALTFPDGSSGLPYLLAKDEDCTKECNHQPCGYYESHSQDHHDCQVYNQGSGCSQCKNGFFKKDFNHHCTNCYDFYDGTCDHCEDIHGCTQCKQGYFRQFDADCGIYTCIKMNAGHDASVNNCINYKTCHELHGGDTKDGDVCSCHDLANCHACHFKEGCDQCKYGYFKKDYDYPCVDCQTMFPNCRFCTDFDGCQQCEDGCERVRNEECGLYECQCNHHWWV